MAKSTYDSAEQMIVGKTIADVVVQDAFSPHLPQIVILFEDGTYARIMGSVARDEVEEEEISVTLSYKDRNYRIYLNED
jgi:hypothetical protein